jgi:hypothetical protein
MIDNYEILPTGVIKQVEINPFFLNTNDSEVKTQYINKYNGLKDKSLLLNQLRFNYLLNNIGDYKISKILDIGYGNGDFLNLVSDKVEYCFGYDVVDGVKFEKENIKIMNWDDVITTEFDVITMFDSFEHFVDIDVLSEFKTKYVLISVPWCHNFSDEWFLNWRHRRPDEHLFHFDIESLTNHFKLYNYNLITFSNIEDEVRIGADSSPNILTAIFKKEI